MVADIITDVHLLHLAVLGQFDEEVLKEVIEMLLVSLLVQDPGGTVVRVHVDVGEEDRLGKGGLDMLPGAPLAVTTGPDLEIEGAVDPVGNKYLASKY